MIINWLTSIIVVKQIKQTNSSDGESTQARQQQAKLASRKVVDALEESRQICWKRFVIALTLTADLFFHKRMKSETPNRHFKAHPGIFRFVTFNPRPPSAVPVSIRYYY